jgi:hypothetical protein
LQKRPDISQQGSPSVYTTVATIASWKVEVKEGEIAKGEQLGVARRRRGDLDRHTREDGNGSLGPGEGGGEEGGVASSSSCLHNGGVGGDLLHEGEVRAVLTKEVRQTGKIRHEMQVEGEDGEERTRGLSIVPTASLHHG